MLFITYGTLLAVYSMLEASYESFCFFQDPDAFFSASNASPERINGTQTVVDEDKDVRDCAVKMRMASDARIWTQRRSSFSD